MPEYLYEPPVPMFESTIAAFQRFTAPQMVAVVEPDPLGLVNKVVRLCRDQGSQRTVVKSVLCPVPTGATVTLGRDDNPSYIPSFGSVDILMVDTTWPPPGWYITVDGVRVLSATDTECQPATPPAPKIPWRTAIRRRIRHRAQAAADHVAARFGYRRDELGDDW